MRLRAVSVLCGMTIPLLCLFCAPGFTQSKNVDSAGSPVRAASQGAIDRGKYIVEDIAVCAQCHTPRDGEGQFDRSKWLEGAALWLNPAQPTPNWPLVAPRIAGDPPGTDAEMIRLLTTGVWREGKQLRPPMPQFRMSEADAEAVLTYLKSLTPKQ